MGGQDARFGKCRALLLDDHGSPPGSSRGSVSIRGVRGEMTTGMAVELVRSREHDGGGEEIGGIGRGRSARRGSRGSAERTSSAVDIVRPFCLPLCVFSLGGSVFFCAAALGIMSTRLLDRDGPIWVDGTHETIRQEEGPAGTGRDTPGE